MPPALQLNWTGDPDLHRNVGGGGVVGYRIGSLHVWKVRKRFSPEATGEVREAPMPTARAEGLDPECVPGGNVVGRQQHLIGITVGNRRNQQDLVRALGSTSVEPNISCAFALDKIADALNYELLGNQFGKIGITM